MVFEQNSYHNREASAFTDIVDGGWNKHTHRLIECSVLCSCNNWEVLLVSYFTLEYKTNIVQHM